MESSSIQHTTSHPEEKLDLYRNTHSIMLRNKYKGDFLIKNHHIHRDIFYRPNIYLGIDSQEEVYI